MDSYNWYQQLAKPSWAPPAWLFGPVWTVLYLIIALTFGYTGYLFLKGTIPSHVLMPFILNLVFNFAFTPIQFGLRNNWLASLDILLVLGTLVWALAAIHPHATWVAYANIPYALWVTFASVLQLAISIANR